MLKILKQRWWKWLGVLLLFVSFFFALTTPLHTGITYLSQRTVTPADSVNLEIHTYGAHLEGNEKNLSVFVVAGKNYICTDNVRILAKNRLAFRFYVPSAQLLDTISLLSVVVNNDKDGTFSLRDAIVVEENDSLRNVAIGSYCDPPEVASNEPAYFNFPYRELLLETIRNLFFHVPMWFVMTLLLFFSFVFSIAHLSAGKIRFDQYASAAVIVSLVFGVAGLVTGMTWANFTWGEPWPNDVKLNGAAIAFLSYTAYMILRGSINDEIKKGRISGVYNIFAFVLFIAFIYIIPRMNQSIHPGQGGNPAFSQYDLDNNLRVIFYPMVLGWMILGFWILSIVVRKKIIEQDLLEHEEAA